ncbi:MAG: pantetheine-phosphate adenylyltransferase [Armatimonadetes bacterium]|nr:pantetheine-phosphate adenylyltransferase [Armatimonadota bacterium]
MRRAIYPGSFDPPTLGHLDIIERASGLFDEMIVAIGVNSDKSPFLSVDDRAALLEECAGSLKNVRVAVFSGLLVDYADSQECNVIVRGLRAVSDFEYEFRVAMANRKLAPHVETLFLITRDEYSFLSSSVVREVARLGGDATPFVPGPVARHMAAKTGLKG